MRKILKTQRKIKKLTQKEVAENIGVSRSAYTNIETGIRDPSFALSLKIKKALGYYGDDIFNIDESEVATYGKS